MENFGKFALALCIVFLVLDPVAHHYAMMMSPDMMATIFQVALVTLGVFVGRWMRK